MAIASFFCKNLWRGVLFCRIAAKRKSNIWPCAAITNSRSVFTSSNSRAKCQSTKPLKQWTLIVNPFGSLKVQLPCNVSVGPLDPHHYPEADRAFVTVKAANNNVLNLEDILVKYDEKLKQLLILSEKVDSSTSVDVIVPLKLNLDVKTYGGGNVEIKSMECDSCRIETEKGDSTLQLIKSQKVCVHTGGGKVTCLGTVFGNVDIHGLNKSTVDINKLQGTVMNISTEGGMLKTKYIYAESSHLSSTVGDIELGSVHDSSDGTLNASTHQGDIDVYIIRVGNVTLQSDQGCITVKVPSSIKSALHLSGTKVDISPEIQLVGANNSFKNGHSTITAAMNGNMQENNYIKASTLNGTVTLRRQSWFQSLKFKTV
ncbi:protein FAM185A isoform X2 [Latimeria chalumnae]|uniref:protein FAM185A isoform X2 n=1 Tax=Latimeria chalumnae TaxID=7897 RepID=UPI0006D9182A|nr:PREDICTED: protein FAM185A isoform X2 [Latimeria chalumnae]|eukprot:XP_014351215.1 PREDICTED: protein FAM185A isoform X2 [Latimeria chalumnae]